MDNLPSGWEKRRSGILVPRPKRRRAPAVGGLVIAAVLLASPVANGVSDLAHAAVDVLTLVRVVLTGDAVDSTPAMPRSVGCPEAHP